MNKDLILARLQENPFLTGKELALELSVSITTANRYIKMYSNKTFSERLAERNRRVCTKPAVVISSRANQVILGSLLGDGSIIRKRANCSLQILHSRVQEEYAKYKYNLLLRENLEVKIGYYEGYISNIDGRDIRNNGRIVVRTSTNTAYNKYREDWYSDKKHIPDSVYELDDLGLAIWFMDDGTSNKSSFYISTQCFTTEDQLKLVDMMEKNFDIECHIHKQKNTNILYIVSKDRQKFIDIIRPHLCPSMNYKIIGHNKQGELLES